MNLSYSIRWLMTACVFAASMSCFADGDHPLHIKIPIELDHKNAVVQVYQSRVGKSADWSEKDGFTSRVDPDAKIVQALVYYPGYRLMTLEYWKENMRDEMVFEPEFLKLPAIPITLKLVETDGTPVVGNKVVIERLAGSVEIYRGMNVSMPGETVAEGVTDAKGLLRMQMPNVLDDTILTKHYGRIKFLIRNYTSAASASQSDCVPSTFEAQKDFPSPMVITNQYRGMLYGSVKDSFLERNGLIRQNNKLIDKASGLERTIIVCAHHISNGNGQGLGASSADGSVVMSIPPGKYNLSIDLWDENRKTLKTIPLEQGYSIGEREIKNYSIR